MLPCVATRNRFCMPNGWWCTYRLCENSTTLMMMMMMTLTTLPELAEMYGLLRLPAAFRLLAEPAQGLSATRLSVRARLVLQAGTRATMSSTFSKQSNGYHSVAVVTPGDLHKHTLSR